MKLLASSLLFLVPFWAFAAKSVIVGGTYQNLGTSAEYNLITGAGDVAWNATEANRRSKVAQTATFSNLAVYLSAAPSAGKSRTFTLRDSSGSTACAVTISGTNISATSTAVCAVPAFDAVSLLHTPAGNPTGADAYWVMEVNMPSNESLLLGSSAGTAVSNNQFVPLHGGSVDTIEIDVETLISATGTVSRLVIGASNSPTSGNSRTYTVNKNSVATALACTDSGDDIGCVNLTDSFDVVPGDSIVMKMTASGAPPTPVLTIGAMFTAATAGEFMINASSDTAVPTGIGAVRYGHLSAGDSTYGSTEADFYGVLQSFTAQSLYVEQSATLNTSQTYTLRQGAGDTALACTIASGSLTCNSITNVTMNAGALGDYKLTTSGTFFGGQSKSHYGLRGFVTPRKNAIIID
jgi:hypothetical protein